MGKSKGLGVLQGVGSNPGDAEVSKSCGSTEVAEVANDAEHSWWSKAECWNPQRPSLG
jgi:hypothetical protein